MTASLDFESSHFSGLARDLVERGLASTATQRGDVNGRFPTVLASGDGAWVTDVDGRRLLDLTACSGTVLLGYRHPEVDEAVMRQVTEAGNILPTTLSAPRVALAERLRGWFPAAEQVAFFKTGSCATTAAARLARVATERPVVLTAGYHGWHDWQLQWSPSLSQGDPRTADFAFSLYALERMLERLDGRVACVFMTPEVNHYEPWLFHEAAALAHEHGALFVLDEVMTGFRYGAGGYHGAERLPADLVIVSKGLANGYAISALMGSADVMAARDRTHVGGTFDRETLPMVAALASLGVLEREDSHGVLERMGRRLLDGLNEGFARHRIPARAIGHPALLDIVFEREELAAAVYREAFARGVYPEDDGTQLVTCAFDSATVDFALEAFDGAMAAVADAGAVPRGLPPAEVSQAAMAGFAREAFGGVVDPRAPVDELVEARLRGLESPR